MAILPCVNSLTRETIESFVDAGFFPKFLLKRGVSIEEAPQFPYEFLIGGHYFLFFSLFFFSFFFFFHESDRWLKKL